MLSPFDYQRVATASDAVALLRGNPEAKLLAGGQSLLASMRLGLSAPTQLLDLQSIPEFREIKLQGAELSIGAMATHAMVAASPLVQQFSPMLAKLAHGIADEQIRQRGTIGGAIANNDPAACWPCGLMALKAVVVTSKREISCEDFFQGMFTTALEPDEIVCAVRFAKPKAAVYLKFDQPASRFAIVGVAAAKFEDFAIRVAITGLGSGVVRFLDAEEIQIKASDAMSDLHASAQYRVHLAMVLTKRAIAEITASG